MAKKKQVRTVKAKESSLMGRFAATALGMTGRQGVEKIGNTKLKLPRINTFKSLNKVKHQYEPDFSSDFNTDEYHEYVKSKMSHAAGPSWAEKRANLIRQVIT